MERQTPASIVAEIDRLLEDYTAGEIADLLNRSGRRSGEGRPFHTIMVVRICKSYGLKSRYEPQAGGDTGPRSSNVRKSF